MRRIVMALALLGVAAPVVRADDQQVANEIAQTLKASGKLKGYNIKVSFHQGVARLDGWVKTREQLDQAIAIVDSVPDVDNIVNRLTIQQGVQPAGHSQPSAPTQPQPSTAAPRRTVSIARQPQPAPAPRYYHPVPVAMYPHGHMQPVAQPPMARGPMPMMPAHGAHRAMPAVYDQPSMPAYSWPSYAAYPNYAALTYPKQYSPTAWPYIGPFYPYPQVPLGWRKVTLEWDDGWWFLDFSDDRRHCCGN